MKICKGKKNHEIDVLCVLYGAYTARTTRTAHTAHIAGDTHIAYIMHTYFAIAHTDMFITCTN